MDRQSAVAARLRQPLETSPMKFFSSTSPLSSPSIYRTLGRVLGSTALLATTVGLMACESKLTGNEGNFQFSYPADDRVLDFNKPIAVGATLEVSVSDVGSDRPVELSAAAFDDPNVLSVESFSGNQVILKGIGAGGALLSVEGTTADGEALTDSVNFLAAVPEVMKLRHSCTTEATAAYLAGSQIWVPFELEMENGQPVIGKGVYPVDASDTEALALDTTRSSQTHLHYDVSGTAQSATLTPSIGGDALSIEIAEASAIDGIADPIDFAGEDIDAGETAAFYVLPKVGDATVCQANANKTVTSDTPEVCSVRDRDAEAGSFESGWFEVEGLAEGECLFTISYPAGNAGAGASAQFSFPIEP